MKLPYSWIKKVSKTKKEAENLAEDLTLAGIKVESVSKKGNDVIIDFEITTNRGDQLGILGIAREVAAIEGRKLEKSFPSVGQLPSKNPLNIQDESGLCSSFASIIIENVEFKPSPKEIKEPIEKVGIRSLGNIVDITNLVMIETGIPIHAFDIDKIKGQFKIRQTKKGEHITTLDGKDRQLPEGSLIIEDKDKIFDLLGMMGGQNSEVDESTKNILLWVPVPNPVVIRKTGKTLGFRTEASTRYEKKLDQAAPSWVVEYAASLILKEAGGQASSKYERIPEIRLEPIEINLSYINLFIGETIETKTITKILENLHFEVAAKGDNLTLIPPSFRPDVKIKQDVIEEIVRIYGFNNFSLTIPEGPLPTELNPNLELTIKETLTALGFYETLSASLISQELIDKAQVHNKVIKLLNPMSDDYAFLRPSLLPTLLVQLEGNLSNFDQVSLFESGKVFLDEKGELELPLQPTITSAVSTQPLLYIKGAVDNLAHKLNLPIIIEPNSRSYFEIGQGFIIKTGTKILGEIGQINSQVLGNFDIKKNVSFLTIYNQVAIENRLDFKFKPIPKYPFIIEDVAILVDQKHRAGEIIKTINNTSSLIYEINVTDDYKDKKMSSREHSLTFQIKYYSEKGTLSNEEIGKTREKILQTLKQKFSATIR